MVEQLNEFIQELKDIDTSIAAHVRPSLVIACTLVCNKMKSCAASPSPTGISGFYLFTGILYVCSGQIKYMPMTPS